MFRVGAFIECCSSFVRSFLRGNSGKVLSLVDHFLVRVPYFNRLRLYTTHTHTNFRWIGNAAQNAKRPKEFFLPLASLFTKPQNDTNSNPPQKESVSPLGFLSSYSPADSDENQHPSFRVNSPWPWLELRVAGL